MSEGRQLALFLAGAFVLAAIGAVAATVFPEPCEEVEGIGTMQLAFADASAVLPVDDGAAATVEAVGEVLGIGGWRGAVALPAGTDVLPSDFGFFAVTDTDMVALRPGSGLASAPRDVTGTEVVPVGGTSAGVLLADGTFAVISSDYERERCGSLPTVGEPLAVDRGFALVGAPDDPRQVGLWALSGGQRWSLDLGADVLAGTLEEQQVLVVTTDGVTRTLLNDPSVRSEVELDGARPLAALDDRVLVVEEAAPDVLVEVTAVEDGTEVVATDAPGDVVAAAATPAGVVLTTGDVVATDRGTSVDLPDGLRATAVVVSEDGHVGVVVGTGGLDVLLVWGRDLP